jgi:parvulin-like peptidyl-prolyl isomerase
MGSTGIRKIKTILALLIFVAFGVYAEAATINKVVAIVNDEVVTQQDIDQLLAVLYANTARSSKATNWCRRWNLSKKIF